MNDKPIFVIGEQHAGRDIFNIARDLNVNQNSPAEDILKLIEAIQQKVGELDIAEKDKKRIVNQIEGAKIELEDEKPDKKLIAESITGISTMEFMLHTYLNPTSILLFPCHDIHTFLPVTSSSLISM